MTIKTGLLCFAIALPACLSDDDSLVEELTTTLAASAESTADLDVVAWDVTADGELARVVGRDAGNARVVELVVRQAGADRVEVESATGAFALTSTGEIDSTALDAQLLGAALYADLGHETRPIARAVDGLGTASSASTTKFSGQFSIGWSFFGAGGINDVGGSCPNDIKSNDSGAFTQNGIAVCQLQWASPTQRDCHARISWAMAGWNWDICHWHVDVQ